jgi:hypothetical protein
VNAQLQCNDTVTEPNVKSQSLRFLHRVLKVVVLALFVLQLPRSPHDLPLAKAPVLAAEILASKPICWGKLLPCFAKVTMTPSLVSKGLCRIRSSRPMVVVVEVYVRPCGASENELVRRVGRPFHELELRGG